MPGRIGRRIRGWLGSPIAAAVPRGADAQWWLPEVQLHGEGRTSGQGCGLVQMPSVPSQEQAGGPGQKLPVGTAWGELASSGGAAPCCWALDCILCSAAAWDLGPPLAAGL